MRQSSCQEAQRARTGFPARRDVRSSRIITGKYRYCTVRDFHDFARCTGMCHPRRRRVEHMWAFNLVRPLCGLPGGVLCTRSALGVPHLKKGLWVWLPHDPDPPTLVRRACVCVHPPSPFPLVSARHADTRVHTRLHTSTPLWRARGIWPPLSVRKFLAVTQDHLRVLTGRRI